MSQFVQGKTSDNKLDMNLFLRVIWLPFLKPHKSSGHEANSLPTNQPDYCHDKPYDNEQLGVYHYENCLFICPNGV